MPYKDKEKLREYRRQYRLTHREEIKNSGKQYYLAHKQEINKSQRHRERQLDQTRKAQGLCLDCGDEVVPSHTYCLRHLQGKRLRGRGLYQARKAQGLCIRCGKEAVPGMSRCIRHVIAHCLKQREYIASHTEEIKEKNYVRYKLWVETRRCTRCGVPLDEDDGAKCCNCSCGISMNRRDYNRAVNISKLARRS